MQPFSHHIIKDFLCLLTCITLQNRLRTYCARLFQDKGHFRPNLSRHKSVSKGASMTRLGDLLDFGQLFKACASN